MLYGVLVLKQKNICEVKEMALVKKENMTDIAYACLVKHSGEVAFKTLWQEVAQMMKFIAVKVLSMNLKMIQTISTRKKKLMKQLKTKKNINR